MKVNNLEALLVNKFVLIRNAKRLGYTESVVMLFEIHPDGLPFHCLAISVPGSILPYLHIKEMEHSIGINGVKYKLFIPAWISGGYAIPVRTFLPLVAT